MVQHNHRNSLAICTITTRSHIKLVGCLMDSFFKHHPDGIGYILYLDDVPQSDELSVEKVRSIHSRELRIAEFPSMLKRYNTFELCNGLKPFLLQYLLAATEQQKLCYFDSDIFIFAPLDEEVWNQLDSCSILLTPHLCHVPDNDPDLVWRDLAVLQHGVYNGGFIGIHRSPETQEFLQWWQSRIIPCGYKKLEEGMNCDQRWLDLVPGFALNTRISRHPGLNAAYWNLHERCFALVDGKHFVNGEPLKFFHFSGYSLDHPEVITKHWTRFTFDNRPDVKPIFDEYHEQLTRVSQLSAVSKRAARPHLPSTRSTFSSATEVVRSTGLAATPDVSVIIPAFNAAPFLREAIDSVLEQTLIPEIIVVDDGSTDDTRSIVEAYGDKIRLISQSHSGVSAARNRGIDAACGAFIAFLDADDHFLLPTKLAEQLACFEQQPNLAIVHSGWRVFDENGERVVDKQPWVQAPDLDLRDWLLFQPALPSAMMFRRDALFAVGGFDCHLGHLEDVELALRLSVKGHASAWIKKITTAYRRHDGNASLNVGAQDDALTQILDKFFAQIDLPLETKSLEREVRYNTLVWIACQYHHAGRFEEMARRLVNSLRYCRSSTSEAFLDWIERFKSNYLHDWGQHLSVFDLTGLDEWREMVRSELIGITPDEAFFPSSGKKRLMPLRLPATRSSVTSGQNKLISPLPRPSWPFHNGASEQEEAVTGYPAKLNLSDALRRAYGRHRSGWQFAMQSLKSLHADCGIIVDPFPEHSFDPFGGKQQIPYREPWIGFLHNPASMPRWFIYNQSPQRLWANEGFQESLKCCLGVFCLSKHHKRWLEQRLQIPVVPLLHPTSVAEKTFSMKNFLADKRIVQIGSWLRKLHSIYYLPVKRLKKAIAHQHVPYIQDLFGAERTEFKLEPDYDSVEVFGFLSNSEYDDLLSRNIVYLELYDSSANNTIIECMVRNTPVLVNPLPAVREYLGDDYPFYFTTRDQAARKAEDPALIEETHQYLHAHPIKQKLTPSFFLKSVAESEIYQQALSV